MPPESDLRKVESENSKVTQETLAVLGRALRSKIYRWKNNNKIFQSLGLIDIPVVSNDKN